MTRRHQYPDLHFSDALQWNSMYARFWGVPTAFHASMNVIRTWSSQHKCVITLLSDRFPHRTGSGTAKKCKHGQWASRTEIAAPQFQSHSVKTQIGFTLYLVPYTWKLWTQGLSLHSGAWNMEDMRFYKKEIDYWQFYCRFEWREMGNVGVSDEVNSWV